MFEHCMQAGWGKGAWCNIGLCQRFRHTPPCTLIELIRTYCNFHPQNPSSLAVGHLPRHLCHPVTADNQGYAGCHFPQWISPS